MKLFPSINDQITVSAAARRPGAAVFPKVRKNVWMQMREAARHRREAKVNGYSEAGSSLGAFNVEFFLNFANPVREF